MIKSSNDAARAWVCNPPGRGLFGPQTASGVLFMQPAWPATPSLLANQTARVATGLICSEGPQRRDEIHRRRGPRGLSLVSRSGGVRLARLAELPRAQREDLRVVPRELPRRRARRAVAQRAARRAGRAREGST